MVTRNSREEKENFKEIEQRNKSIHCATKKMDASFPYPVYNRKQLIECFNRLAQAHVPFLFVIDYHAQNGYVIKWDELDEDFVRFELNGSAKQMPEKRSHFRWEATPVAYDSFVGKFNQVVSQIKLGNSFLTNLTQPTKISTNLSLLDFYNQGQAKYKLWLKDQFVVLSPETFVKMEGGMISSFPMKGTIDASLPDAESIILNDPKEKAEHATIVDLIRNDLSLVASDVQVKRYRYVERINTHQSSLIQVSSEITGTLPDDYLSQLGDILFSMLPAGSICGAPKQKTLEIIDKVEGYARGFYTGVCGYFDGQNLDSAVMIRFLEQTEGGLVYKSGGGITAQSEARKEYEELIQKIYVPVC
jgi:para-aminobenzoate synthetase component I